MTKYSTGNNQNEADKTSCTLCGESDADLRRVRISGAVVDICESCAEENDFEELEDESNKQEDTDKTPDTGYTISSPDSSWAEEGGLDYGNASTPYLVKDYSTVVSDRIEEIGVSAEEISEELGVETSKINSIINGTAVQDSISGDLIGDVEEYLDVSIVDDV